LSRFLQTDESEEAVSSLEMFGDTVAYLDADIYRWKWAILALHSAVQGFMVLALRGSNSFDVLSREAAKAWTEAAKRGVPRPGERLDSYGGLYRKVKSNRMLRYYEISKKFEPQGT